MTAYLTCQEVCQALKLSRTTLWRLTTRRRLPYAKLGARVLFRQADVEALVEAGMVQKASGRLRPKARTSA